MNWIIGGIAVLALILGGAYYVGVQDDAVMEEKEGVMMEKEDGVMMEKEDAMMDKKDSAMEGTSMVNEDEEKMMSGETMMQKGGYQDYSADKLALANEGTVVLYFHADWCPICRPLDAEFRAKEAALPIHILKVNYDTATALKQQYGVTYQHTFVQVDAEGNMIAKWGDARNLADVLAKVQ